MDAILGASALSLAVTALLAGRAGSLVELTVVALNLVVGWSFLQRSATRIAVGWRQALLCGASVPLSAAALELTRMERWPLHASALFVVFGAGAIAALLAMGESFAVLPAVRPIVARGPFRLVRHPLYACELGMVGACALAPAASPAASWYARVAAAAVFLAAIGLVVLRIRVEERVLSSEAEYDRYAARVRWRLLPHLW